MMERVTVIKEQICCLFMANAAKINDKLQLSIFSDKYQPRHGFFQVLYNRIC